MVLPWLLPTVTSQYANVMLRIHPVELAVKTGLHNAQTITFLSVVSSVSTHSVYHTK